MRFPAPRHSLITGASSGIGAALVDVYAAQGVRLSLQGRDIERLNRVAEKAERRGAVVTIKVIDVTDAEGMKAWVESCDALQPLDLVIANAGISGGTFGGEESEAQTRAIFAINVTGVLNTVLPAVPLMTAREGGQIALMSSLAGFRGMAAAPAYGASKAAVRLYGEGLRGALRPKGIGVSVICPGFVTTPMTAHNPFFMPFLMAASQAARIIRRGLAEDRARIAFPWAMAALVRLFAALPQDLLDSWLARVPGKRPL